MSEANQPGEGKICLVTGASSGIGYETARALSRYGARVLLVGRDRAQCAAAVAHIRAEHPEAVVDYILADLSSQAEVRQVAGLVRQYARLDVLINNVGAAFPLRRESADGVEMTLALNHLSHFLLTNLLIETLKAGAPARVITVSSFLHARGRVRFDDLQHARGYNWLEAYTQAKLANLLFTHELARRLDGSGVSANAVNPGLVATYFALDHHGPLSFVRRMFTTGAITPAEAARSCVYLALAPEVAGVSGRYFERSSPVEAAPEARDEAAAARLWQMSSELAGLAITI